MRRKDREKKIASKEETFLIDRLIHEESRRKRGLPSKKGEEIPMWRKLKYRSIEDYVKDYIKYRYYFFKNELKIVTKLARMEPLLPKTAQIKIMKVMMALRKEKKPVRVVVVKVRRLGSSSLFLADCYAETTLRTNFKSVVIAHRTDSTDNLLSIIKTYHDYQTPELRPMRKKSNAKELIFRNPDDVDMHKNPGLNSQIKVFTAGGGKGEGKGAGAALGETIHYFLGSEVAMWGDYAEGITGAAEIAVPKLDGTTIVYESSGYGMGGFFKDLYFDAVNGQNNYTPIFVGFQDDEDCVMKATKSECNHWENLLRAEIDGNEHEKHDAMKKLGLMSPKIGYYDFILEMNKKTDDNLRYEQVKYLKDVFENECHSNAKQLRNMYPADAHDAFMYGASNLFDNYKLDYQLKMNCVYEPKEMVVVQKKEGAPFELTEAEQGSIKVWETPLEKGYYILSMDVSEGVGNDYTPIHIYRLHPFEQVARFSSNTIETMDSKVLALNLAKIYNYAFVIIEANSAGIDVVNYFINQHYANLYHRIAFDDVEKKDVLKAGWKTGHNSKWTMQLSAAERINKGTEGTVILRCRETVGQLMTIQRNPDTGLAAAPAKQHDDEYIAFAMACVAAGTKDQLVKFIERQKERLKYQDKSSHLNEPSKYPIPDRRRKEVADRKKTPLHSTASIMGE